MNQRIKNCVNELDDSSRILQEALYRRVEEANLFSKQFGSFSKSDYEILMFTVFLDTQQEPVRDYDLSIQLGLTESKVRNLRVKSQLLYPKSLNWIRAISESLEHGFYDRETKQITITIEDPSVQNKIKNVIETNCGHVGFTLNRKQIVLNVESFLILAAFAETDTDETINRINEKYKEVTGTQDRIEKKAFGKRFLHKCTDSIGFINSIAGLFSVGAPIVNAIVKLMT